MITNIKKNKYKKLLKRIFSLTLNIVLVLCMFSEIYAGGSSGADDVGHITTIVWRIVNVVSWFGYTIAFGMFVFVGIKYMMASANERADVKKGLISYLIGAFLIASASTVARLVVNLAGGDNTAEGLASEIISTATGIIN